MLGSAALSQQAGSAQTSMKPVRVVVAGLVHGHAAGFFNRAKNRPEIEVASVVEANRAVGQRYAKQFFPHDASLLQTDLAATLDRVKPEAVLGFTNTFDHLELVRTCADRKIHVMVEKPLAISKEHGFAIAQIARQAGILVLVNYETTWYPSMYQLKQMLDSDAIGPVRKLVVRDGHKGPAEIGVPPEFLDWLTDPKRNGAGALFDFGCYGADLATWIFQETPVAVTAVTQQLKPSVYSRVDDDATILLQYSKAQVVIQASWNWPYSRKDLDAYGANGYILAPNRQTLLVRKGDAPESTLPVGPLTNEHKDEIAYLYSVVRGGKETSALSSLETNLIVTEILDAARESAQRGVTVKLERSRLA